MKGTLQAVFGHWAFNILVFALMVFAVLIAGKALVATLPDNGYTNAVKRVVSGA